MIRPVRHPLRFALALLLAALPLAALPAAAGTITGTVHNGTTGQLAPGVDVILLQLQGGMQSLATTKTDAQGRFHFDNPAIGQQPMLLRAVYRGVDYHEPVPPGQSSATVSIDVYEPTTDPAAFQVLHHIVALQPQGDSLLVGEEFDLINQTKPPKAFFLPKGSFTFQIPDGAELSQVEAWGPSGMPVVQGPVDEGKNRYGVVFPFRPGQNGVRLSYKLKYPSNQATFHLSSLYSVQTALVLAPPPLKIIATGFAPSGSEHGWDVYSRSGITKGASTVISVSGTAPPPSDTGQDQSAGAQQGGGSDSGVTPVAQALPPRLDSLKWILIGGFGSLFVLGALLLWWKSRNPSPLPAAAPAGRASAASRGAAASPGAAAGGLSQSVEEIKDTLFKLELKRQAGTLSEEEYQARRRRAEEALRSLLKD
jgi:hypothetical protein